MLHSVIASILISNTTAITYTKTIHSPNNQV